VGQWGTAEPIDTCSCRLLKSVDSLDWPAMILGAVAVEFEIAEPPELVEPLRELDAGSPVPATAQRCSADMRHRVCRER